MSGSEDQRKQAWTPTPRPEWLAALNKNAANLDMRSVVPLDGESLIEQAVRNTGLDDFGDQHWRAHFDTLTRSVDTEANLHFGGRILTRSEFIRYLEKRLQVVDCLKNNPVILEQKIEAPIFIFGFGRSGTTILYELLAQDPQFRVPQKWETFYPCPPPEKSTYASDARILKTEKINEFCESMIPELQAIHKSAATLPVESVELLYFTFLSEVFAFAFQAPEYTRYLATQDMSYCFNWLNKLLKLLQWRNTRNHWLLKGPSHMPYLNELLSIFPDAKIVFTHRDPIVSADSVVSLQASLYWWRTDTPWGDGSSDSWVVGSAETRAGMWDGIIDGLESGDIDANNVANFHYAEFMRNPLEVIEGIYQQLNLTLKPDVRLKMETLLEQRPQQKFGKHQYERASQDLIQQERISYQRYQSYFDVENEI